MSRKKITIQDLIKKWQNKLDLFDLEMIIATDLNKNQSFVISHPEYELNFWKRIEIEKKLKRRSLNFPLAYLNKKKEFYGRDFSVNKHVLVPRPETELIIDSVLKKVNNKEKHLILDIGTGSGNIIVTLAKELKNDSKNYQFIATDISKKALKVAKKNAKSYQVEYLVNFFHSDLLKNKIVKDKLENFSGEIILIANLPYINKNFKNNLLQKSESKSLAFEPQIALWSSNQGLDHYEKLMQEIAKNEKLQNKKFTFYFEISPEQNKYLTEKIKKYFPQAKIEFKKDLANFDRLCIWKKF